MQLRYCIAFSIAERNGKRSTHTPLGPDILHVIKRRGNSFTPGTWNCNAEGTGLNGT